MTFERAPIRVTHLIHDLRRGGAEHLLVDLARVAGSAGIDMSVVSLRPLADHRYAEELSDRGIAVRSLDLAASWDLRGPHRLARLLPTLAPQLLHSHLKHADVVGGRVAARLGLPHISTLHLIEDGGGWLARRKRGFAIRARLATANRTVAVSDALRRWYLDVAGADPDAVVTIHNGVPDPEDEHVDPGAVRDELGIDREAVVALMVAVMRPGKGHDTMLDALALMHQDIVVVCAGSGPEEARLRARVGDDQNVLFAGFREDIGPLFAAVDLVVHPSLFDALPTALVHAIAAGKPVVASDVGGIAEIVPEGAGVLVSPGDPAALAAAIDLVAGDAGARSLMGKKARERYEEEFTATKWVQRLYDLYVSVLDRS